MTLTKAQIAEALRIVAEDARWMEVGRLAVEDELIYWRDDGLSSLGRNNGYTIKSRDGAPSSIVRFGPEVGWQIAANEIARRLSEETEA